jgi:hypothetical protein
MTPCRTATLIAAAGLLVAGPVFAQTAAPPPSRSLAPSGGAAATLPNAFDAPVAPPVGLTPPATTTTRASQVTDAEMAEAALRTIIGQIRSGELDTALFTPDLGTRLEGRMGELTPMVQGYGELLSLESEGPIVNGAGQYRVTFDGAVTQWLIGLEEGGLIAALLFRPAPEDSEETTPAPPPSDR